MRKQIITLAILLVTITIPRGTVSTFTSSVGPSNVVNILVDETKGKSIQFIPGEVSIMAAYLEHYGFKTTSIYEGKLTGNILSKYSILTLMFPAVNYTEEEISAIQDFVGRGGSLLFVGTAYSTYFRINSPYYISNNYLNVIANLFNVTFNDDSVGKVLKKTDFLEHPLSANVESLVYNDGCTLNTGNNVVPIVQAEGQILVAATEVNSVKVAFVGSVWPFNSPMDMRLTRVTDHYQFILNIFNWLSSRPPESAEIKGPLTEAVGPGPLLTEEQKDEFILIRGAYHIHTSDAGGAYSTSAEMVEEAMRLSCDYMIMTDYDNNPDPLIGAFNAIDYIHEKGYDLHVIVGTEVTRGWGHISVFPVNREMVGRIKPEPSLEGLQPLFREILSAGGMVVYNHPSLMEDPHDLYNTFEDYDMSGIEIINSEVQIGTGDLGVSHTFLGACDAHNLYSLDRVIQYLYVRNVTDSEIIDAILNRRVIIYTPLYDLWIGEKVWLDEYFHRMEEAELEVAHAQQFISLSRDQGRNTTLASKYLNESSRALEKMNPDRAVKYSKLAVISAAMEVDVKVPDARLGEAVSTTVVIKSYLNESIPLTLIIEGANWKFSEGSIFNFTIESLGTRSMSVSTAPQISGTLSLTAKVFYQNFELSSITVSVSVTEQPTPIWLYALVLSAVSIVIVVSGILILRRRQ